MNEPDETAAQPNDAIEAAPSEAELDEWAMRERQRREAWLSGPTETEKAAWARRERDRRLAERERKRWAPRLAGDPAQLAQRSIRQAQLAVEGAASLLFGLSLRAVFDELVRAGRDWEDQFMRQSPERR